jgi:hypothetical protein
MTFKEEINLQLRDNKMLSYEILSLLKDKNYFSGRNKQIGDTVLFGILKEEEEEGVAVSRIVTFHEEEIGTLYEEDNIFYKTKKQNRLPNIKRIENDETDNLKLSN